MSEVTYCDHCGDELPEDKRIVFTELPFDVESANEGESGVVCEKCLLDKGWKLCYCCGKPVNLGSMETGECLKCSKAFHMSCDQGWHTEDYLHLCSDCKP